MSPTDSRPDTEPVVTRKRRECVFENSRFSVYSDHICAGNLEVKDFLVVAPHGHRADLLTGVAVVAHCAGRILLLRVWRHPAGQHTWEVPRGFIDEGEEPEAAAVRELAEETGLRAAHLISLGCSLPDPGLIRARIALFAAAECVQQGRADGSELGIEGAAWFSVDEIRRMLTDASLEDGVTCVALWRYLQVMQKGS